MKKRVFYSQTCDTRVTLSATEFVDMIKAARSVVPWYADFVYRYQRADETFVYIFFIDEYNFSSETL